MNGRGVSAIGNGDNDRALAVDSRIGAGCATGVVLHSEANSDVLQPSQASDLMLILALSESYFATEASGGAMAVVPAGRGRVAFDTSQCEVCGTRAAAARAATA